MLVFTDVNPHFQQAGAHGRPKLEKIIRWTLRDDGDDEIVPDFPNVDQDFAGMLAEIERGL